MDRLVSTVEEETARLRVGQMREAVKLDAAKGDLARAYAAETERVKAARHIIAKDLPDALVRACASGTMPSEPCCRPI